MFCKRQEPNILMTNKLEIYWSPQAELSFQKELDFISLKWGNQEASKFIDLVDKYVEILASGLIKGRFSKSRKVRLFLLSKQTTLIYKIDKKSNTLHLVLFWNNRQNPNYLNAYL